MARILAINPNTTAWARCRTITCTRCRTTHLRALPHDSPARAGADSLAEQLHQRPLDAAVAGAAA